MPIIAETDRLNLRTWQRGDGTALNRLCNTSAVMRYLGGIQGEKNLRGDVAWFGECFDTYGFTLWVMERKRDGAFLGFCGLDRLEHDVPDHLLGRIEVGWRLREDTWGEGYATEGARVSLDIAFRIRNMDEVISRAGASLRIMEKLGMKRAEELECGDGHLVYVIRRADWLQSQ